MNLELIPFYLNVSFLLLSSFSPSKALNQFHALQMLFTLLGLKHLLLTLAGFFSFSCSCSLSLADFQRRARRSTGPVWKCSIAPNVLSRWVCAQFSFPVFIDEGQCYSLLLIQTRCNLFSVLSLGLFIVSIIGLDWKLIQRFKIAFTVDKASGHLENSLMNHF